MKTNPHPQNYGDPETFARDVELEGPAEVEFNPGIAGRLPAKSSAGGVLLRDRQGRILFVVPRYKPVLDLPGGITDDNESPKAACQREVKEELGIQLDLGRLLVVDWIPRNGVWRDSHQFIFDGGVLDDDEAAELKAHDDELGEVKFLPLDVAAPQLHPSMLRRLQLALTAADTGETIYAEFGRQQ